VIQLAYKLNFSTYFLFVFFIIVYYISYVFLNNWIENKRCRNCQMLFSKIRLNIGDISGNFILKYVM